MRTSFVDPIKPSMPSTISSFGVPSSRVPRLSGPVERVARRYTADAPTAAPSEKRSSDLGRDEKDMNVKLRIEFASIIHPRSDRLPPANVSDSLFNIVIYSTDRRPLKREDFHHETNPDHTTWGYTGLQQVVTSQSTDEIDESKVCCLQ